MNSMTSLLFISIFAPNLKPKSQTSILCINVPVLKGHLFFYMTLLFRSLGCLLKKGFTVYHFIPTIIQNHLCIRAIALFPKQFIFRFKCSLNLSCTNKLITFFMQLYLLHVCHCKIFQNQILMLIIFITQLTTMNKIISCNSHYIYKI